MRSAWIMVAALVVGGVSPGRSVAEPATKPGADSIAAIHAAIPAIDSMFVDFQLDAHAPGLVYGVVADGRLIHVKAIGTQELEHQRPVTADSLFRIASMTKSFTALSILKLRDEGKL